VLVHGSVTGGAVTWARQRPLAERWELLVVDRPGFGATPAAGSVDFEVDASHVADVLADGAHLVGHSYGGVVSLLAAALRPEAVRSLTVVEPPAFALTRGVPEADALVDRLREHWRSGPRDPEAFLRRFMDLVGADASLPSPLPPPIAQGARVLLTERGPWEAEIPLDALRAAPFPILAVSGAHSPAFDAVCDALELGAGARRAVIPGAGHSVQRTGEPFNAVLEAFLRGE
jgi:pimeloyl-ACP methyl ester carboxylesterase